MKNLATIITLLGLFIASPASSLDCTPLKKLIFLSGTELTRHMNLMNECNSNQNEEVKTYCKEFYKESGSFWYELTKELLRRYKMNCSDI